MSYKEILMTLNFSRNERNEDSSRECHSKSKDAVMRCYKLQVVVNAYWPKGFLCQ